jgi:prepilin-type N-terminal cleavage/methylation domain-containing protein
MIKNRSGQSGLSLLEIMIALGIVGILATMAVPTLKPKQKGRFRGTIPIATIHQISLSNVGTAPLTFSIDVNGFNVILGTADGGSSVTSATYYDPASMGTCLYSPGGPAPHYGYCTLRVPYQSGVTCTTTGANSRCVTNPGTITLGAGQSFTFGFGAQKAHMSFTGAPQHYEYWGWSPAAVALTSSNAGISFAINYDYLTGGGRLVGHQATFEDSGNASTGWPLAL